ncbi:HAD-IIIC family phosphatase [Cellulosimicrobium cellulans]|uniref:Haloacid dehalogenase n=1 Tax=Cellulosimicrobium cellulans TaxID=1710 RepID=A0A4Y4E5E5_CELCE|nr:HAD-IIIC family phosphatase [Cellulosimicrobium cellulans]GED10740.1 haloacid dehalogenase [Cellulosimicrobium cellulans]
MTPEAASQTATTPAPTVKAVVWDLDGTLWDGVLSEGGGQRLRPHAVETLRELDRRGILCAIASKNEPGRALARLDELGVEKYFVAPQISWDAKSSLVSRVADELNIGLDTLLFLDDSEFERAEVAEAHPMVRCVDPADLGGFLDRAELDVVVTREAGERRRMYREAAVRRQHEETFVGPRSGFLASLDMHLTVRASVADDLDRAVELTQRTHQLNTTGLLFDRDELTALMSDDDHLVLSVELVDRFGDYGTVGLVLVSVEDDSWRIRLFLMSCRVMGRNVGGAVLATLAAGARREGRTLTADFRPNEVNRPMYTVYRLSGFADEPGEGDVRHLRLKPGASLVAPDYLHVSASFSAPPHRKKP